MPFRKGSKKLCNCKPLHPPPLDRISVEPFDVSSLESEPLMRLYREAASGREEIRVEIVASMGSHGTKEKNPASVVGLEFARPTIRFSDSLRRGERIEAIAHECMHLQLSYRHGLGVVGRRIPRPGSSKDVFHYFMSMRGDWVFLLGQVANTAHHLMLIDYLRNEYGIESYLYRHLLQHNFRSIANDKSRDKESICAKGLIAFEYERLVGTVDRIIDILGQTDLFWNAYHAAQKHFGGYSSESIPSPAAYKEDILSFLEELGYQREDFVFFP
jgi:hypothetical protein